MLNISLKFQPEARIEKVLAIKNYNENLPTDYSEVIASLSLEKFHGKVVFLSGKVEVRPTF